MENQLEFFAVGRRGEPGLREGEMRFQDQEVLQGSRRDTSGGG
jgi:hypothetical protein